MNEELKYYLALDSLSGIGLGYKRTCSLIEFFGSAENAWLAEESEINTISNIPTETLEGFIERRAKVSPDQVLEKVLEKNIKPFCQTCTEYPQQLKDLKDPPLVLYTKGLWENAWLEKAIGIVGTRDVSQSGAIRTKEIASQLASNGFTIISGLAMGVDSQAHLGALAVESGRTVAVVANGVDLMVPASTGEIYKQLINKGCVVSEYPPGTQPQKGFFPARNRIIAALSQAVLVSEAGLRSGALITAERAIEISRPLFGLAGSANNKTSEGINYWIRKGKATFVTSAEDILEELDSQPLKINLLDLSLKKTPPQKKSTISISKPKIQLNEDEQKLYDLIPHGSYLSIDKLIEETALPISKINSILLTMQLKKLIAKDFNGAISKV